MTGGLYCPRYKPPISIKERRNNKMDKMGLITGLQPTLNIKPRYHRKINKWGKGPNGMSTGTASKQYQIARKKKNKMIKESKRKNRK